MEKEQEDQSRMSTTSNSAGRSTAEGNEQVSQDAERRERRAICTSYPGTVLGIPFGVWAVLQRDENGEFSEAIAKCYSEADANALVAAPEVLASLKAILAVLKKEAPGTALNHHRYDQLGIDARAAIAKAEGR